MNCTDKSIVYETQRTGAWYASSDAGGNFQGQQIAKGMGNVGHATGNNQRSTTHGSMFRDPKVVACVKAGRMGCLGAKIMLVTLNVSPWQLKVATALFI